MSELTDRGKAFRTAIAGFIGNKLKKLPRGGDGNYDLADMSECRDWLLNAVANIGNATIATHPIRITHSSIKGASSVYVEPSQLATREEIGTHSVPPESLPDFAITNSPQVPACQLLLQRGLEGKALASWLVLGDQDLIAALAASDGGDVSIVDALTNALDLSSRTISHRLAKQVYWLVGDEPQDDEHYELLQPMFSSTLDNVLYEPISRATDDYFRARGTQKKAPTFACHAAYTGVVQRNIGGANPQNVSPLNSVRHGNNYLLASLPPAAWKEREGVNLRKADSVFNDKRSAFYHFGEVRTNIRELGEFLKSDPDQNKDTRDRVNAFLRGIAEELALFGAAVRGREAAGWSRHADCRLPLCEQLWLDPERTELPERNDPAHPHLHEIDLAFKAAYTHGDWADEVAGRFGRWLNGQLRKHSDKLAMLGDAEMRHFASKVVLDVAWPMPRQRHAKAGVA